MSSITVGDMGTFTYNVTTANPPAGSKVGKCTIVITGFTPSNNQLKTNKSRWIGVKIDGKTIAGVTADPIPKVVCEKNEVFTNEASGVIGGASSGVSGVITTSKSAGVIYVKTKKERNELRTQLKQDILRQAFNKFQSKLTDKISSNKNKKTISVSGASRQIVIQFSIFGYTQKETITVGVTSSVNTGDTALSEAEYLSIASVNNGKPYLINQEAYNEYGWIETMVDFNEVTNPTILKQLGQLYINSMQFDNMTLQLNALDLHYLNKDIPSFNILDRVRCISAPHGLDKLFPITEISIPLDSPDQVTYTLGNKPTSGSMSNSVSMDAKKFTKQLGSMSTKAHLLDAAKAEMSAKLNRRTTGYVNIVETAEKSQAIIISSNEDWQDPNSKIWKWDMNGLGYSDKTISSISNNEEREAYEAEISALGVNKSYKNEADDRWYKIGITNDGVIVADIIKAGILMDATGTNFWNLSDGTFSLTPSSVVVDDSTDTTLSSFMIDAETARYAQYGGANYLRSTNKFDNASTIPDGYTADTYDSYMNFGWIFGRSGNSGAYARLYSALKTPTDTENVLGLAQRAIAYQQWIPLYANTTYTLSFYAKCDSGTPANCGRTIIETQDEHCHITFMNNNFESEIYESSGVNLQKYSGKMNYMTTKWKRYSYTFFVGNVNDDDEVYKIRVKFGNSLKVEDYPIEQKYYIYICSPQLERGNIASDWTPSISDIYHNVSETSETDRNEWKKTWWTKESIYNKLTENSTKKGIFLENGNLFINADMINSGIIKDTKSNSIWDLTKGTFKTDGTISGGMIEVFPKTGWPNKIFKVKKYKKKKKKVYKQLKTPYPARKEIAIDNGEIRFKWHGTTNIGGYGTVINCGTISCANNNAANKYTTGIRGYRGLAITTPNLLLDVDQLSVGTNYAAGKDISVDIPYSYYKKGKLKNSAITLYFYKGLMVGYKVGDNKPVGSNESGVVFDDVAAGISDGYATVTDITIV